MKEFQVDTIVRVRNCFYVEAETEEEAWDLANNMKETELEKFGLQVEEVEEFDICEC